MASNLTRNEARERARLLTVQSYQVDLDLTAGESTFGSATTVRFTCSNPGSDTFIDLTAPEITEIVLNGAAVDPGAFDGHRIALTGLAESNELRVVADCAYSHTGEGLHRFTDPADKGVYMYSDLETFDAHQIYACFDQPDLKATFELTVIAQDDWEVISNMPPAGATRDRRARAASAGASRPRRCCRPTSPRSPPGPTTWSARSTTASRWASSAASRWPSTWTRTRSSRSPGRALTSTSASSSCGTRSASTTSCSCPSSRRARWRTPAA